MRSMCGQYMVAGLAVFTLFFCAGCGLVGDAATHVQAMQLPPGKLCFSEFYDIATPEEVKKEIGDKSLTNERYIYKSVARPKSHSIGGGIMEMITFPFMSFNYVSESAVDPLRVASLHTPYAEVMVLLLEAGAGQLQEREKPGSLHESLYYFLRRHSDEKSFRLLRPYLPEDSCERFVGFLRASGVSMEKNKSAFGDYLAFFPDTDMNCRNERGGSPLETAMRSYSEQTVQWLLGAGANADLPLANGKIPLARAVQFQKNLVGMLLDSGATIVPLTKEERKDLLWTLRSDLGDNLPPEEEEKLEKLFEKAIGTGDQGTLKKLGGICTLPRNERRGALQEMFL